ncbi:MAG TPA: hypothetical protein VGB37_18080, partial [Candidatus Lokiarchaeia archaeon]
MDSLPKKEKIDNFRTIIETCYNSDENNYNGGFDTILCFELHSQPVNPRMGMRSTSGFCTGLTFNELAQKWGISVSFLGELIADHCKK